MIMLQREWQTGKEEQLHTVDQHVEGIKQIETCIEHERLRQTNLQLMNKFGPLSWRLYADQLVNIEKQ